MFNIAYNGIITVNRGDSFTLPFFINIGTNMDPVRYQLKDNDILYVGVMEPNQPFENAIVRKKYTVSDTNNDGDVLITFKPQDTQCLLPGRYYYQIKLQIFNSDDTSDYDVNTVVDKTQFFVLE